MQKITMYTKENCPYCIRAKNLLKQKGISTIDEIRIDLDSTLKDKMIAITGRMTVPQIFIGDVHVGGCDDLFKLNQDGKLDQLLQQISN